MGPRESATVRLVASESDVRQEEGRLIVPFRIVLTLPEEDPERRN